MTKDEYIAWIKKPMADKTYAECVEADRLLQKITLINANNWIDTYVSHPGVVKLLKGLIADAFYSIDTDNFLKAIKAYPEWM